MAILKRFSNTFTDSASFVRSKFHWDRYRAMYSVDQLILRRNVDPSSAIPGLKLAAGSIAVRSTGRVDRGASTLIHSIQGSGRLPMGSLDRFTAIESALCTVAFASIVLR